MAEPFTGSHWETRLEEDVPEGRSESDDSSEETGSSEEDIITPQSKASWKRSVDRGNEAERVAREEADQRLFDAGETIRAVNRRAYWRNGGDEFRPTETMISGWREVSTSGSSLSSPPPALAYKSPIGS